VKQIMKFKGRVIIKGAASGEAVVSINGFNSMAVYKESVVKKTKHAICSDPANKDLYNKRIDDKIICLPQITGSTTAGIVNTTAAILNYEPRAYLFAKHIDTLGAAGALFTKKWTSKKVIYIDNLGDDFLKAVKTGMHVNVYEDGTVEISS